MSQAETDEHSAAEAADETPTLSEDHVDTDSTVDNYSTVDDLSEQQRDILAVIAARPEATQREIGDTFDLSATTINNRVNSIPGFEWQQRASFVADVFDEPPSPDVLPNGSSSVEITPTAMNRTEPVDEQTDTDEELLAAIPDLKADVEQLSHRLVDLETAVTNDDSVFENPELVHKIVYACMESETLTKSEELHILKALLQ